MRKLHPAQKLALTLPPLIVITALGFNYKLYEVLADAEKNRPRVPGYGRRPGDN